MFFKVFGGQRLSKTASEGPNSLSRGTCRAPRPKKRSSKMDPISIICWTDFGAISGSKMGPKMETQMDLKKVEPIPKHNPLPPLEIDPGRVLLLKQVLGGVGVNSDIQINNS